MIENKISIKHYINENLNGEFIDVKNIIKIVELIKEKYELICDYFYVGSYDSPGYNCDYYIIVWLEDGELKGYNIECESY